MVSTAAQQVWQPSSLHRCHCEGSPSSSTAAVTGGDSSIAGSRARTRAGRQCTGAVMKDALEIGAGGVGAGHGRQVVSARVGALFGVGPREEKPISIEMEAITGEEQFDEVLAEAQVNGRRVVIEWMANWCRKCIYLKPKLERLAVEYHPNTKFYCVDVNAVPSTLVKRAGVTKMPTIQLWIDAEKQGEVIGGHKAWQVLDEIREMLQP